MKRRYLSVLVIGFLVAAGFSGCEDAAGGITDVPRNTTTITKAGNINLKYNGKHLVVTYDASAGKVRYSAVPGYILTKVTLTMLDGSKEATSVTASYDGTGAAKYEKDGNDENYDITTIGYVKAGAAEQTTIDTIEFSSTENFSKYSGKIDLELVGATEHLKFDPSWVASFIADDGYGNEVLRLNALVDEGYVIDWTAYVYSEEFWNDNKDYDGDDAKKIKNKDKIDAAIESHDVLDALAPSGGGGMIIPAVWIQLIQ
ncbi:MAG: hypothetical protein LBB22_00460 [Treponema sp.]|jgi:hypothetical protein|nr:hypothetical protein [Treponema sp.]